MKETIVKKSSRKEEEKRRNEEAQLKAEEAEAAKKTAEQLIKGRALSRLNDFHKCHLQLLRSGLVPIEDDEVETCELDSELAMKQSTSLTTTLDIRRRRRS